MTYKNYKLALFVMNEVLSTQHRLASLCLHFSSARSYGDEGVSLAPNIFALERPLTVMAQITRSLVSAADQAFLVSLRYLYIEVRLPSCDSGIRTVDAATTFWAPLMESCTDVRFPRLELAHLIMHNNYAGAPLTVYRLRRERGTTGWNWVGGYNDESNPFNVPDIGCTERNAPEGLVAFLDAFSQP
jgi:hypothetical protein